MRSSPAASIGPSSLAAAAAGEPRRAVAADLDALVALEAASFSGDRLSRRSFRRLLGRASAAVLVIADRQGLAGAAIVLFRDGSRVGRLYSIAVALPLRGLGLGRHLVAACEEEATKRGARALRLEVRADNAAALRLYLGLGYRDHGRAPGYYEDGGAAIRLEKALPRSDEAAA